MNDDPISIKVSSSWICLLFGRHRDRWALATLSWRDQSQIHEFCKDVDDGFVLARIWTSTVWSGLWIIFLEWWLSRIGIGIWQSAIANRGIRISICQLVVDQRSQHFRLDLLILGRVSVGVSLSNQISKLKSDKFQSRYKKNRILFWFIPILISNKTRKV